jgi:hypothetical protein
MMTIQGVADYTCTGGKLGGLRVGGGVCMLAAAVGTYKMVLWCA